MERKHPSSIADHSPRRPAILVVSIGNSSQESCLTAASAVAAATAQQFPDCWLRKVFVNRKLDPKNSQVKTALDRAASDGIHSLVVQPSYLTHGAEYKNLAELLEQYQNKFEQLVLGEPLLTDAADFKAVQKAIVQKTAAYNDPETAVCFVGHGKAADTELVYRKMHQTLAQAGYRNYYIGTLKSEPSFEDVKKILQAEGGFRRVVLHPFMTAAGSHAYRDIAGDQSGSWKRMLEQAGYEVICILEGLAQIPAVQEVFAAHAKAAAGQLHRLT